MRAVIQRVAHASVSIGGQIKGQIARGLLVFVAVEDADTADDIEWLTGKIVRLRIFPDDEGLMNRSVQEISGEILLISQFTLFASAKKGNRPSYTTGLELSRNSETHKSAMNPVSFEFMSFGFNSNPFFRP